MSVYGEEHFEVDITKGLFISPAPDSIPDGFCQLLYNLIRNERGGWELRKGFTDITTVANSLLEVTTGRASATDPMPNIEHPYSVSFDKIIGGVQAPETIFNYLVVGGATYKTLHQAPQIAPTDTVDFNTQQDGAGGSAFLAAAQYKDRVYGATANNSVAQYSNFKYDGTTPNLTVSVVAAALSVGYYNGFDRPVMVTYESRIWMALGNRIWYTDIPAAGGYPETWAAANFIDLPPDNTGSPSIRNMLGLNGILYIFTSAGIYALNGKGSTSTWSLDFVSDAIKVRHKKNVDLVNGVFICTDKSNLFSFDGSAITKIGPQIQYLFNIYNTFNIVPFEKGFILSCRYMAVSAGKWIITTPPGVNSAVWGPNANYYFDGQVWSQFATVAIASSIDILDGLVGRRKNGSNWENVSYIIYYDIGNLRYGISYYDKGAFKDTINGVGNSIFGALRTRWITSKVGTQYLKTKVWYAKVFSLITTVVGNSYKNGSTSANVRTNTKTLSNQGDNNYLEKFEGPEECTRFALEIVVSPGSAPTIFNTDLPDSVPIFEVKELWYAGDTNVRDSTEQTQL